MRNVLFATMAAVAVLGTAGGAMAQNTPQQKTDQLAQQIQTQITALGPNASAADIQAVINTAVANSGDTPTEALAAIQAVAASNPGSATVQTAANASATIVLTSVGGPQAQAQVRAQASVLATQAVQQLASNTTNANTNNRSTTQLAQNTTNNNPTANNTVASPPGFAVAPGLGIAPGLGVAAGVGGLGAAAGSPGATGGLGGSSYR